MTSVSQQLLGLILSFLISAHVSYKPLLVSKKKAPFFFLLFKLIFLE